MSATLTKNDEDVFKACKRVSDDLWSKFESSRYIPIAEEFYPIAIDGLRARSSRPRVHKNDGPIRASNFAQECLKKGATGFSVNLTSPAREWFSLGHALRMRDSATEHILMKDLEQLTRAVREVFEECGFYHELDKLYEHLLCFGTGCMLVVPADGDGFKYLRPTTLRFGTYALGIDSAGLVNRCCRKFEWTAAQIADAFGIDALPPDMREHYAKGEGHKHAIAVYNLIEPNGESEREDYVGHLCGYLGGWRSVYWADWNGPRHQEQRCRKLLDVKYLKYQPIIAPRFEKEAGDVWGRGRGEDALPLARALNALRKDLINVSGNYADPALFVDASLQGQQMKLERGGITFWNSREGVQPSTPAIPQSNPIAALFDAQTDIRNELNDCFLVSRFATIDALKVNPGVKTATEVEQLVRENMGLLGPVVTNLEKELLSPLVTTVVDYTLDVAKAEGFDLGGIAPVLQGAMKIRYVGEVHAAMKSGSIAAIRSLVGFSAEVMQAKQDPSVVDAINADMLIREFADAAGVKPSMLVDPKDVEGMRAQRAQVAQQAQQNEAMLQQAQAMKAGAGAVKDINGTPVGNALMGGLM